MRLFFHKLTHWEYWPFYIVYVPVYFQWAWYALKSRSIFYFSAANPTIRNGGYMNESKKDIYDLIPQRYYPATVLVRQGTSPEKSLEVASSSGITFPFIVKPDMGLRGSAVKKIEDASAFENYVRKANFDFLIQDIIPYENEIGIFYIRYPDEEKGRITGIVAKEFLIVTGDGTSTITQLLKKNPRHELQLDVLQKEYGAGLDAILAKDEKRNLVPYGNHCRGSKFLDASHWITPELENVINDMCLQIDGFYFGRMDLMYRSLDDLYAGKHFMLVELNGAGSEPTHIYDPSHSLFFAWKELTRHLHHLYRISVQNRKKSVPFLTFSEGLAELREHNRRVGLLSDL